MSENQELIREFLVESYENLDRLDREFVVLEKDPHNQQILSSVFRTIHTIKGTCGFLGFSKLESVTHVGENLLSKIRDGKIELDTDATTALLQMVDSVRQMLSTIEATEQEGSANYLELVERLTHLTTAKVLPAAPKQVAETVKETPAAAPAIAPVTPPTAQVAPSASATPAVPAKPIDPLDALLEEELRKTNEKFAAHVEAAASGLPIETTKAASTPAGGSSDSAESHGGGVADASVRVDVGLLDRLMNLVGELVLTRNRVIQHSLTLSNTALASTSQHLNHITTELQEAVMKTRMQPIGNIWSKLPRVVRDLSKICGKTIAVEMEGKETELDKTIIEAIKDPLTHVVRNSVDHGIETPEERISKGKPAQGTLRLRAFHEGGQVNIEISDDGAGIRIERVKKKAVEKGLITEEQAFEMSDHAATQLIFLPGFSTAEKVTNVSGRGVGMDVVRTNIEKIGGKVELKSNPGLGTTLIVRIPLTLAIIPALVITSGKARFAIPQMSLLELVRLDEQQKHAIELIHGSPVYRLRGNLLPLVYLNEQLKLPVTGNEAGAINIVVLQADNHRFGLVVDAINDSTEIVVKPLSKIFNGLNAFAGATVMGDGRVALILDVMGLAQNAHLLSANQEHTAHEAAATATEATKKRQSLLIFSTPGSPRIAIPLKKVARLEEIPRDMVENIGGKDVVQYRGSIMPLVSLESIISGGTSRQAEGNTDADSEKDLQVIVHTRGNRSVGFIISTICDIVDDEVVLQEVNMRPGVLGSAVIGNRVTELLDVDALAEAILTHAASATSAAAD